jgi:hypothetical protein
MSEDLQVLRSFPILFPEVTDTLHTLPADLSPSPKSVFFAGECPQPRRRRSEQPRACPRESLRGLAQTGCKHSLLGLHSLATRLENGGAKMVDCVLAAVHKFQPVPAQIFPASLYINIHDTFCSQRNGTLCIASTHFHADYNDEEMIEGLLRRK